MPYNNVPKGEWGKMDKCVKDVMAGDKSLGKQSAIAICHESIVTGKAMGSEVQTEIERLRQGDRVMLKVMPDQSFSVMVKDLKHYLRSETDG